MMEYIVNSKSCKHAELNNTDLKDKWYGLNSTDNFGCVTYLYKKYGSPDTYQLFYDSYVSDSTVNTGKTNGRTEDYIWSQAIELSARDCHTKPLNEYYDYIIQKLIIDTFDGEKKEVEFKKMLISSGYTVQEPTYMQDIKEGIDKLVYRGKKLMYIVQVKPNTFFLGNNNKSLLKDRLHALEKETLCKTKYNVPVLYVIYNKNTGEWVKNNNGGYAFKLNTLIDEKGRTKNIINK